MGPNAYRGAFSLLSLGSVVLIVIGYGRTPVEYLFNPMVSLRPALIGAMPIVMILFASANMPTHIRKWLRHPMLIGTLLWSGLHLLVNGERAPTYLFGAFLAYAAVDLAGAVLRRAPLTPLAPARVARPPAWKFDIMAVVGGAVVYAVVLSLHGWLFGVSIL